MADVSLGPNITGGDVEQVVVETLKEWLPYFLARVDEEHDLDPGTTIEPLSYNVSSHLSRWTEMAPPALVVVSPGLAGDPEIVGEHGSYMATWRISVGVTVGGATEVGSRALAHRYAAAVRNALVKKPVFDATWWVGEQYDTINPDRRSLIAAEIVFHVQVIRAVDTRGVFPDEPPTDPEDPGVGPITPVGRRIVTSRIVAGG